MFVFCLFGSLTEPLPCKPNAKFSLFFILCSGVLLLPFLLSHSYAFSLCLHPLSACTLSLPAPSLCLHPLGCPLFRPLGGELFGFFFGFGLLF